MENKWISVETDHPTDKGKRYGVAVLAVVLHYTTDGKSTRSISIIHFKDGDFYHHYIGGVNIGEKVFQKVSHWMYLPEMPKKHKSLKPKK